MKVFIKATENGYRSCTVDAHSAAEVKIHETDGWYSLSYNVASLFKGVPVASSKDYLLEDCSDIGAARLEALKLLERNLSGMVNDDSDLEFVIG